MVYGNKVTCITPIHGGSFCSDKALSSELGVNNKLVYVAFCTIMAISRQKPEVGIMPYSSRMTKVLYSVTAHSRPLNSLEHCICTTSMTNIRPDRDSIPVPLCFESQPDRMSHLEPTNSELNTTIPGFTFTVVDEFRRFLSQFSINFHEILHTLFSIHVVTTLKVSRSFDKYLKSLTCSK